MNIDAPLSLWSETVLPAWCDYNGHMNVAYYLLIFDHATDALWDKIGLGPKYRDRTECSTFAVECHMNWIAEALEGDRLRCTTQLLGCDEKRMHYFHHMYHGGDGHLVATIELMSLHVDLGTRKVCPLPDPVQSELAAIRAAHQALAVPDQVGHVMGVKPKA